MHIVDTYGPMPGCDQLCDAIVAPDTRIGDSAVLVTEDCAITVHVASLHQYREQTGELTSVMGVGLRGEGATSILPGDTLYFADREPAQSQSDSTKAPHSAAIG